MTCTHSFQGGSAEIRFDAKPPERIRAALKSAGFRWSPAGGCWWRRKVTGAGDLVAWIQQQLDGPRKSPCWDCQSPDGTFRNYGAATPVLCDACDAKRREREISKFRPDPVDLAYEDDCARRCGL